MFKLIKQKWLIITIWIISDIIAIAKDLNGSNNWQLLSILIAICSLVTINAVGISNPLFYILSFVVLQFSIKPVLLNLFPEWDYQAVLLQVLWFKSLLFQLLAYSTFSMGYLLSYRKSVLQGNHLPLPPKGFSPFLYSLVWGARIVLISLGVGSNILGRLTTLSPIVLMGLIFRRYRNNSEGYKLREFIFLIVFFVLEAFWCILSKTKLPLMIDILVLVIGLSMKKRTPKYSLIMFVLVALTLLGGLQIFRDSTYQGTNWLIAGINNLIDRSDTFDTLVRVFYYTPNTVGYWGKDILVAFLETTIIPFPFPGKSLMPVGNLVAQYYYGYDNPNVFLAIGFATSWYITVGWVWSLIIMGIYGVLLARVLEKFRLSKTWFGLNIFIIFLMTTVNIEQSYFEIFNVAFKDILILLVIYQVWNIVRKKERTQVQVVDFNLSYER